MVYPRFHYLSLVAATVLLSFAPELQEPTLNYWKALAVSVPESQLIALDIGQIRVGDSVEVLWQNKWWPARVLEIKEGNYCITYEGFDSSWNECVTSERIRSVSETADAKAERFYQVGFNYLANQDYLQAIESLEQSLAISEAENLDNAIVQERVYNALSTVYAIVGNFDKLEYYAQKHLAIAEQLTDSSAATIALVRLGTVYFNLGEYAKAEAHLKQALEDSQNLAPASRGFALSTLVQTYLASGKTEIAIAHLEDALQTAQTFNDPELQLAALEGLGIAYVMQQNYSKAINFFEHNRETAQQYQGLFDISILANAWNNLGFAFLQANNLLKAEDALSKAVDLWESQRSKLGSEDLYKVSIFELQALSYTNLQKVLILQGKPEAALEIAERGRARALVELLAQRLSPQTLEKVQQTPPTLEEIRKIAETQNATLVEYSLIDTSVNFAIPGKVRPKELAIWVIKPTGEVGFEQVDLSTLDSPLENLVTNTRQSMGVGERSLYSSFEPLPDQTERLQQLHQLLIEPIAQYLPTNPDERIIFLPQGELFLVPFPALQDASGKYLIEKHTILTAPAIQVLELTREQRSREAGGAGEAGGDGGAGTQPQPIPGGEKEGDKGEIPH